MLFYSWQIICTAIITALVDGETAANLRVKHSTRTSPSVGFCLQDAALENLGKRLECTAASRSTARIVSMINVQPKECMEGALINVQGTAIFEFPATMGALLDFGLWWSTDGDPGSDGSLTGDCTVATPEVSKLEYANLDGDACGDLLVYETNRMVEMKVSMETICRGGAYRYLKVPYCLSWRHDVNPNDCSRPEDTFGSTGENCCICDKSFSFPIKVLRPQPTSAPTEGSPVGPTPKPSANQQRLIDPTTTPTVRLVQDPVAATERPTAQLWAIPTKPAPRRITSFPSSIRSEDATQFPTAIIDRTNTPQTATQKTQDPAVVASRRPTAQLSALPTRPVPRRLTSFPTFTGTEDITQPPTAITDRTNTPETVIQITTLPREMPSFAPSTIPTIEAHEASSSSSLKPTRLISAIPTMSPVKSMDQFEAEKAYPGFPSSSHPTSFLQSEASKEPSLGSSAHSTLYPSGLSPNSQITDGPSPFPVQAIDHFEVEPTDISTLITSHPNSAPGIEVNPSWDPSDFPTPKIPNKNDPSFERPSPMPSERLPAIMSTPFDSTNPLTLSSTRPSEGPLPQVARPSIVPLGSTDPSEAQRLSSTPSSSKISKSNGMPSLKPNTISWNPSSSPIRQLSTLAPSELPSVASTTSSVGPSRDPSTFPAIPSILPAEYPDLLLTAQPTIHEAKALSGTSNPISVPIKEASEVSSFKHNRTPSWDPSGLPTEQPDESALSLAMNDSKVPSAGPSDLPSTAPSDLPSTTPSDVPSTALSDLPSTAPSEIMATTTSEWRPSATPSTIPSNISNVDVTTSQSVEPSAGPTTESSATPTIQESAEPSIASTVWPTAIPTRRPSAAPSHLPSESPSISPTDSPSKEPSIAPSTAASNGPTATPSEVVSHAPSSVASLPPSTERSKTPSVSPSTSPTEFPSLFPTIQPTSERCMLWQSHGRYRIEQWHGSTKPEPLFPVTAYGPVLNACHAVTGLDAMPAKKRIHTEYGPY